jgi:hypothetical protein
MFFAPDNILTELQKQDKYTPEFNLDKYHNCYAKVIQRYGNSPICKVVFYFIDNFYTFKVNIQAFDYGDENYNGWNNSHMLVNKIVKLTFRGYDDKNRLDSLAVVLGDADYNEKMIPLLSFISKLSISERRKEYNLVRDILEYADIEKPTI